MADPEPQERNTYIFDPESAAEMGRLILQDRLLNEAMGGLLPERSEVEVRKIRRGLDIGCGPGGWALSLAQKYPHMEVVGIDIGELMIAYCQVQARREGLTNIRFEKMNALQPLRFPDHTFDLVNMRAAVCYVPRTAWPAVVRECVRVACPGGSVRLTEFDSLGLTNSPVFEEGQRAGMRMCHKRGFGFSPEGGPNVGVTFMLGKFLSDAGCRTIRNHPHVVDFSYGAPLHASQVQNVNVAVEQARAMPETPGEAIKPEQELQGRRGHESVIKAMQSPNFRALQFWLTACGEKEVRDA